MPSARAFACRGTDASAATTHRSRAMAETPRIRWIGRRDPSARLLRLLRVVWHRGQVGAGVGYSAKFSVGLQPRVFGWRRNGYERIVVIAGIRLHYARSYGGIYA